MLKVTVMVQTLRWSGVGRGGWMRRPIVGVIRWPVRDGHGADAAPPAHHLACCVGSNDLKMCFPYRTPAVILNQISKVRAGLEDTSPMASDPISDLERDAL